MSIVYSPLLPSRVLSTVGSSTRRNGGGIFVTKDEKFHKEIKKPSYQTRCWRNIETKRGCKQNYPIIVIMRTRGKVIAEPKELIRVAKGQKENNNMRSEKE